jgi:hypothetical protein
MSIPGLRPLIERKTSIPEELKRDLEVVTHRCMSLSSISPTFDLPLTTTYHRATLTLTAGSIRP